MGVCHFSIGSDGVFGPADLNVASSCESRYTAWLGMTAFDDQLFRWNESINGSMYPGPVFSQNLPKGISDLFEA
jgi:hypothetical protein